MKRTFAWLMTLLVLFTLVPTQVFAATESAIVYVTVSDAGSLVNGTDGAAVADVPVTLSGSDRTVNDVLSALHEQYYPDGVSGYGTSASAYGPGLSITKLWGKTDGAGGFYLNGVMPTTTVDATTVHNGDVLDVILYRQDWSDQYAFFNTRTLTVGTDDSFSMTLSRQYYDGTSMQTGAAAGATLTANGVEAGVTDASGQATLSFSEAGRYVLTASGTGEMALTAPVCIVTVVAPIDVTLSAQQSTTFLQPVTTLSVPYGTAEKYGFANADTVSNGAITALDALVAAHAAQFGSAFTKDTASNYLSLSFGNPVELFNNGETKTYSGFAVNHRYPMDAAGLGTNVNGTPLVNGDTLEFFYYEEASYTDYLTWFADAAGGARDVIEVEAGETFSLQLQGFLYAYGYTNPTPETIYKSDGGLSAFSLSSDGTIGKSLGNITNGTLSLSYDIPGTYFVTAMGFQKDGNRITMPTVKILVGETGSLPGSQIAEITVAGTHPTFSSEMQALADQSYNRSSISARITAAGASAITASNNGGAPISMTSGSYKSIPLTAGVNRITFTVIPAGSNPLPRVCTVSVRRGVALTGLTLTSDGNPVTLREPVTAATTAYTATALTGSALKLTLSAGGDSDHTVFTVNGAPLRESYPIVDGENQFAIHTVSSDGSVFVDGTLTVTGVNSAACDFSLTPANANLSVYDAFGNRIAPTSGTHFTGLLTGETYTYTATRYGLLASHGSFTAGIDTQLSLSLTAAPPNTQPQITAQWGSFRGSSDNMAVVSAQTPRAAEETAEKWVSTQSFNGGYNYPSSLLMVNGRLYIAGGDKKLYQIDASSGSVLDSGAMSDVNGAYGSAPIVYGEGMIFVPLVNGTVQAFSASTLDSLWISESLGSQCTTALTYADGYLYGSTGNSAPGSFFCLSVTDEDPSASGEIKYASWRAGADGYPRGSYWSTPLVSGNTVVYGTDAVDGTSLLLARDKTTGALRSTLSLTDLGNQRSGIAASGGRVYFTTQGGYLCSAALSTDGTLSDLKTLRATGVTDCDSTPVIWNGVVYYGANGRLVAADALTMTELRQVSFPNATAKVQSSPLLTTAYRAAESCVYLYVSQNTRPGALYAVRDDGSTLTLSTLYTPTAQNSCNASAICGSDGVLYYRNDSGYVYALEQQIISGCTVAFHPNPVDAAVTIDGKAQTASNTYFLPMGTYSYTASRNGYTSKTGTITVTQTQVNAQTPLTVPVTLSPSGSQPSSIQVSVQVKIHDENACHHQFTYRENASSYTTLVNQRVTLTAGESVFDALEAALTAQGIPYTEGTYGYISEIDGLWEFGHGDTSGWLYRVDGVSATQSSRDYPLTGNCTVLWFYTDDYTREVWSGSNSQLPAIETAGGFQDVPPGFWCYDAVTYVTDADLFHGVTQTHFQPGSPMTRGMLATVLHRLSGNPAQSGGKAFPDVPIWCADAVTWVSASGVMGGYTDGRFGTDDPVTRQQLATILYRYARSLQLTQLQTGSLSPYSDAAAVGDWAKSAMTWAVANGLISGTTSTTLSPTATTTRGQIATVLLRLDRLRSSETPLTQLIEDTAAALLTLAPQAGYGSVGGEWSVLGLVRSDVAFPTGYADAYLTQLTSVLKQRNGVLSTVKYTEYARVVLALTALGKDPSAIAGFDMLTPLGDYEKVIRQGVNGPIWALIALDAGGYPMPGTATRQQYVDFILDRQLPDGGWTLGTAASSDPDLTGMALQALSNYQNQFAVQAAIARGITRLSALQEENGRFGSSSESTVQVLVAMSELGISLQDARLMKNGHTPLDGLLTFYLPGQGFTHMAQDQTAGLMATEQGLYAMVAVQRMQAGNSSLYDMNPGR